MKRKLVAALLVLTFAGAAMADFQAKEAAVTRNRVSAVLNAMAASGSIKTDAKEPMRSTVALILEVIEADRRVNP